MPQQSAHIVHLAVAVTRIAARAVDLLHHNRRLGEAEAGPAIIFRDHGREPTRLGQRVDELDRVGRGLVVPTVILRRELSAEFAQSLAHLLMAVGVGDHVPFVASKTWTKPNSARIASVCSPKRGTGSSRGSHPSPVTGFRAGRGPTGEPTWRHRSRAASWG